VAAGLHPDPLGELMRSPRPQTQCEPTYKGREGSGEMGVEGLTYKPRAGEEGKGRGREGAYL